MREEQQPPTEDDRYWDALVARLGREDGAASWAPTATELADCERQLAAVPQTPLPDALVDVIVEDVSTRAPRGRALPRLERTTHDGRSGDQHDANRRVARQRSWPIAMRAAAAVTLTAALTAAVVSLVWPEGARSHESLDNTQAIELLRRPDQPVESQRAALAEAWSRVERGLAALIEVRDDARNDSVLRGAAATHLRDLAALFVTPNRMAGMAPADDITLAQACDLASSQIASANTRHNAVDALSAYVGASLAAIRDASTALPALQDEVDFVHDEIARSLVR